jgi:uncharacterized membrane protein
MRFVVLFFGLLATFVTATLGTLYFFERAAHDWLHDNKITELDIFFSTTEKSLPLAGLFLLIAAGFCFLGTLLAFFRCGWQGGVLMIVSVVGPALLAPMTLLATGPQLFAALLACFVRPLPIVSVPQED